MCDQKIQRALPVITIMALYQLLDVCTGHTVTHCLYPRTKACSTCYKNNKHNKMDCDVNPCEYSIATLRVTDCEIKIC